MIVLPCSRSDNNVVIFNTAVVAIFDSLAFCTTASSVRHVDSLYDGTVSVDVQWSFSSQSKVHRTYMIEEITTAQVANTPFDLPSNIVKKVKENPKERTPSNGGLLKDSETSLSVAVLLECIVRSFTQKPVVLFVASPGLFKDDADLQLAYYRHFSAAHMLKSYPKLQDDQGLALTSREL